MMGNELFSKLGITLALRCCAGCGRHAGVKVWPWSGRLIVTTHVLCGRCLTRARPAMAPREEVG